MVSCQLSVVSCQYYDPTLELDDVLVLEDGVAQQVRSPTGKEFDNEGRLQSKH